LRYYACDVYVYACMYLFTKYQSTQKMQCHGRFTYRRADGLLTTGLIPTYGLLTTELINENNSWFPHPRADVVCLPPGSSLQMVCSTPSNSDIMHVYVYVYVCAYLFTKYQSTQKMQCHEWLTYRRADGVCSNHQMQCHGRFAYHRADPYIWFAYHPANLLSIDVHLHNGNGMGVTCMTFSVLSPAVFTEF
jgi:hypothetical protein